jgi:ABC-type transport system involved in multi-copper enzyme maturation permease subunit
MSPRAATADSVPPRPMPPPVPGLGSAVAAVFRLQWKRLIRGKKLRLGLIAMTLIVIAVTAARYASADTTVEPEVIVARGMQLGWFRLLAYLLPFLFTSGAIAEDVESRTFTYVIARPVGRFAITIGKYAAGTVMAIALLAGGLLVVHLAAFATDATLLVEQFPETFRRIGAVSMMAMAYGAICMFWGALVVEAAGIISTLYLALVEFVFSFLPSFFCLVSMNYHAMELAGFVDDSMLHQQMQIIPEPWVAAVVITCVTLFFLFLAALIVSTSEYRSGKA